MVTLLHKKGINLLQRELSRILSAHHHALLAFSSNSVRTHFLLYVFLRSLIIQIRRYMPTSLARDPCGERSANRSKQLIKNIGRQDS